MIILGFFKSFLGIFQTANFEGMEVPVQVLGFMEPVVFDIYSIVLSKRWPSPLGSHVNMDVTSIRKLSLENIEVVTLNRTGGCESSPGGVYS